MGSYDYKMVVSIIKRTLKTRGMTYADLGQLVGLSESGVKKMFTAKDGSFGKVCRVCEALGLTLRDILEMDSTWRPQVLEFTEEQETYLLEDREAVSVFFSTAYDGLTIAEVRTKMGLSNSRMSQILRKLDKLNLIQWLPYDQTHTRSDGLVLWQNKGKFVEHIKKTWSKNLLQEALKDSESPENYGHFVLSYFKLTEKSLEEFRQSLLVLIEEYRLRSRHEINFHGLKALKGFRFLAANKKGSFVD